MLVEHDDAPMERSCRHDGSAGSAKPRRHPGVGLPRHSIHDRYAETLDAAAVTVVVLQHVLAKAGAARLSVGDALLPADGAHAPEGQERSLTAVDVRAPPREFEWGIMASHD